MSTALMTPPLDGAILANFAVEALPSPHSRRMYGRAITNYLTGGKPLNREGVLSHINALRASGAGPATLNTSLAAVRLLAREAAQRGLLDEQTLYGLDRIRGNPVRGRRSGNWLTLDEVRHMIAVAGTTRDKAVLGLLFGSGLRRAELCSLRWTQWQKREGRWMLMDITGKGAKIRSVPVPQWAADLVNSWGEEGESERMFPISPENTYRIIQATAKLAGLPPVAAHDARRTYAKLARAGGAPIEQIQMTLGHSSVQTTERYLGGGLEVQLGKAAGDYIRMEETSGIAS